jgi:hypothetical protein
MPRRTVSTSTTPRLSTPRTSAPRVPNTRLPLLITTVGCGGIIALGWVLGAAPALDAAALSSEATAATEVTNAEHRATLAILEEQHSRIDEIRADALSLRQEIPAGLGLPDLVDQMSAVAATHSVTITQYAAEEPVSPLELSAAAQPAAAPAPATTDTATAPTPLSEAELAAAVAAAATAPSSRLSPSNLYAVPITLTLQGTPEDARATLGELQHSTRLFLVTSAEIVSAEPADDSLSEVRGFAYVLIGATAG